MRHSLPKIALLAASALILASCATQPRYSQSRDRDYDRYESSQRDGRYDDRRGRDERCRQCGTVVAIDAVWVDDNRVSGGTLLGVIIGGALGNQVGSGDGRRAATAAGAIAGGVIGHQAEKGQRDQRRGYRIEVRLDDRRYGYVIQLQNPGLRVGDRVSIHDDRVHALR